MVSFTDVFDGQPDNAAASLPDFDRWIVRDNLCGLGYRMRIVFAVRLSPKCNMAIRSEQIETIERHSRTCLPLTLNSFGTYDVLALMSTNNSVDHRRILFSLKNRRPNALGRTMHSSLPDLLFAAALREMSDEDFLLTWHAEVIANDESRIVLVEKVPQLIVSVWRNGTTDTLSGFQIRPVIDFRRGAEACSLGGSDHRCRSPVPVNRRWHSHVRRLVVWAGRFALQRPLQMNDQRLES
jgi:hypothetical protein